MRRLLISLLLLSGCATTPAGPDANLSEAEDEAKNVFLLRRPGSSDNARFDETGAAQGLNFQLTVYEHNTIRGTAYGEPVELVWSDSEVKGSVGALPVDLHLETAGGGLRLVGLYQGNQGDLLLDARQINGQLGRCHYELGTVGPQTYKGQRACQESMGNSTVRLPKRLVQMPLGEFAAYAAVLLSR